MVWVFQARALGCMGTSGCKFKKHCELSALFLGNPDKTQTFHMAKLLEWQLNELEWQLNVGE